MESRVEANDMAQEATPALVLGDDEVMPVSSVKELEQFFGGGLRAVVMHGEA